MGHHAKKMRKFNKRPEDYKKNHMEMLDMKNTLYQKLRIH